MLSPHPPQIHSCLRSLGLFASEHPHEVNCPSRQPRAILWTTPAEDIALAKAASREANSNGEKKKEKTWLTQPQLNAYINCVIAGKKNLFENSIPSCALYENCCLCIDYICNLSTCRLAPNQPKWHKVQAQGKQIHVSKKLCLPACLLGKADICWWT